MTNDPRIISFGQDNFDKTVKPTDDFFGFVNNNWIVKNPIPPDESQWGSFYTLRFDVEQQLKNILDGVIAKDGFPPGSDEQKVRDFYREAMDMDKRNRLRTAPLTGIFKKINAIADGGSLARVAGECHRLGITAFWQPFVEQDEKNSELMALHCYQGGLGLPDRDYYVKDDEKSKKIRADYVIYMADILRLAGLENDAVHAAGIMEIETRLAKASLTRVELRDVEKMYNKMTMAEFTALVPQLSVADYFQAIALIPPPYLVVGQPTFFTEMDEIFKTVALDDLKLYLRWHALKDMATYLSEDFERRSFDFYGRTFGGAKEMKPLWRRALRATDSALDELLGKLYVARYFPEDAKQKIKNLVDHLSMAYRARIEKLTWMGPETKEKAQAKLNAVSKKLGYPDVWKDFTALTVGTDSFAENAMRAHAFEFDRKIKEVGGPVDRNEWLMPPQLVNAYYMPPMNEIAFPAAILQPPFFDPSADEATNFGGIGSVIGHELTHGFDDQGSRFDASGNLKEWWTKEDRDHFNEKAEGLAKQFDAYEPIPGMPVNGKLTLGENIADLGGLLIAYDALKLKLAEDPPEESKDGFTAVQKFFIGYATTERGHAREEIVRLRLQTDPHSPPKFRVNGPLSNMVEFYGAFGVEPGDALWREPEDRVRIW